jgi:phosphoketolase
MTLTNNNKAANQGESFEIVQTPIPKEFELLHRYWQASNYLSVGQVRCSWG